MDRCSAGEACAEPASGARQAPLTRGAGRSVVLMRLTRRDLLALTPALAVLGLAGCSSATVSQPGTASPSTRSAAPSSSAIPRPADTASRPRFNKTFHSIDDPRSVWVVVDKRRPLKPLTYIPPDLVAANVRHTNAPLLRKEAAAALERMFSGAEAQGVRLVSTSAYRSYTAQRQVLASDTAQGGAAYANTIDMRPGYSEHQTGWAVDIGSSTRPAVDFDAGMADTPEGRWLATNAWQYGFHLSYPKDRESVTGILYEPWHFRYVATALAAELHRTGTETLQEFFDVPASPNYG
jgi:D-alanyl-D-alanine carboxypeptidase